MIAIVILDWKTSTILQKEIIDKTKTGNLLKQAGVFVEELRMTLKNQTPRIVKIQAMKKTEPSISGVKYADDHY